MAKEIINVLGQVNPAGATPTTLYTVPQNKRAIISSIIVVDTGTLASTFNIAILVNGAAVTAKDYIRFKRLLPADGDHDMKLGITLNENDEIEVTANFANTAFNVFGLELES